MLCSTRREEVERKLEEWRKAIEERGLKISRKKTEHWSSSEQLDAEANHRVQSGWRNWKKVSGVVCDRKMKVKMKGKVYKTIVRPAMVNGVRSGDMGGEEGA